MMTKTELLLRLAKHAVNWGEGADFEMNELIHESTSQEERAALQHHYQKLIEECNAKTREEEGDDYDDEEHRDNDGTLCVPCSDNFNEVVQKDISKLLSLCIETIRELELNLNGLAETDPSKAMHLGMLKQLPPAPDSPK